VVASLDDADALWFAQRAGTSGVACRVLTTEALSFARRRSHRVTDQGCTTTIEVVAGDIIRDSEIGGVLNRALDPPDRAWQRAAPAERDYASAELQAFMLSWLAGLPCPVRNRPTPDCLAGPYPHPFVASAAAVQAGLPCPPMTVTTSSVGNDCLDGHLMAARLTAGPAARPINVPCLDGVPAMAGIPDAVTDAIGSFLELIGANEAAVGIDFLVAENVWWFAGMTPIASLRTGDLADRLLGLLASSPRLPVS